VRKRMINRNKMSNVNYMADSTSSSIAENVVSAAAAINGGGGGSGITASSQQQQSSSGGANQIITYELERKNMNAGFGFDLKGDRPCIISAVHPSTAAYESGLSEGDLVIAINNRKCIDLDHQQVVALISRCKHKLVLKVTKAPRKMSKMTAVNRAHEIHRRRHHHEKRAAVKKSKMLSSKGLNWVG
jgi:predicted metalloprotease with PDZ domain